MPLISSSFSSTRAITAEEFVTRFKDPVMRQALLEIWLPEFSMFFMLITFAYLHNKNAGYPIGGSLPMSKALAGRYLDLGGVIHYNSRVEKILVEGDQAVGAETQEASVGADNQARKPKPALHHPVIEGYEIVGRLGQGGMGSVWKARELSTEREVAVKFLGRHRFDSDRAKASASIGE